MKKKDVFVWVARHNSDSNQNYRTELFTGTPKWDKKYGIWRGTYFSAHKGYCCSVATMHGISLEKGECRKYKLVEVKE